jgi:hypothetical protein
MPPANRFDFGVSHPDYMWFKMIRRVGLEEMQNFITSFSATDKGHVNDLLAHEY